MKTTSHIKINHKAKTVAVAMASLTVFSLAIPTTVASAQSSSTESSSSSDYSHKGISVKFRPITKAQREGKNEDNTKIRKTSTPSTSNTSSKSKTTTSKSTPTSKKNDSGVRDYSEGGTILPDDYYVEDTPSRTVQPAPQLDSLDHDSDVILPPSNPDLTGDSLGSLSSLDIGYNDTIAQKAVKYAQSKLGSPYVWGAVGPDSFDCSGLTQWVYAQAGKNITRTTYTQVNDGPHISINEVKAGDLVFYGGIEHVGIAISSTEVIHAPQPGESVKVSPIDMMPIDAIVRVAT